MPEVVGTFSGPNLRDESANCPVKTPDSSLGGFAQMSLEFAVRHLDGIEIRRVFRQVTHCRSSGEVLPPRGFGAALPVSFQRCSHLTPELALMPNRSAASRRDAPSTSTASITRSRKSQE